MVLYSWQKRGYMFIVVARLVHGRVAGRVQFSSLTDHTPEWISSLSLFYVMTLSGFEQRNCRG